MSLCVNILTLDLRLRFRDDSLILFELLQSDKSCQRGRKGCGWWPAGLEACSDTVLN